MSRLLAFFKRKPEPRAQMDTREIYRQALERKIDEADAVYLFLNLARKRGFPVKIHFEVDGILTPATMHIGGDRNGVLEYWINHAAAEKLINTAKLDDLYIDWDAVGPSLADRESDGSYPSERRSGVGGP